MSNHCRCARRATSSPWRSAHNRAPTTYDTHDLRSNPVHVALYVAFPNPNDSPTRLTQRAIRPSIALDVGGDLLDPVRGVPTARELAPTSPPVTPVPEVPVAELRHPGTREDDVGHPRQPAYVDAIAEPRSEQGGTQQSFGPRVLLPARTASRRRSAPRCRQQASVTRALCRRPHPRAMRSLVAHISARYPRPVPGWASWSPCSFRYCFGTTRTRVGGGAGERSGGSSLGGPAERLIPSN